MKRPNFFVTSDEAIIDVREVAGACLDTPLSGEARLTVMLRRGHTMHMDGKDAPALFTALRSRCELLGDSGRGFCFERDDVREVKGRQQVRPRVER